MPIDRIHFSTSQESVNKINLKSWKKFGAEYQIEPGENLEDAKKALKDFVYTSLKAQQDTVPEDSIQFRESESGKETLSPEANTIVSILTCKSMDKLGDFKFLAEKQKEKFPEIWAAYQMMEKKLSK